MEAQLFSPAIRLALMAALEERNILVLRLFEELTFLEMGHILK